MSTRSTLTTMAFAASFAVGMALSGQAKAVVLSFDDIPISDPYFEESVSSYGGFQWTNTYAIDGAGYDGGAGTGYANAATSGSNVAFNGYGDPSSVSSSTPFTFNGAYFTSAFNQGLMVTLNGYLNGNLIQTMTTTLTTAVATWVSANFEGIDTISFSASGGTNVVSSADFVPGTQFALDDVTVNEAGATAVPELDVKGAAPAITLLGLAFAMMATRGRRRQLVAS